MNTMNDLKLEVLGRLQHLQGRYFESISTVSMDEMLGIVDVGETVNEQTVKGSILDAEHAFWDDYVRDVYTGRGARDEVEVAIRLLRDEGKFQLIDPDDDSLKGSYVDVESVSGETQDFLSIEVESSETGNAVLRVQNPDGVFEATLTRQ